MVTPARVAWGRPHRQELWDSLDLGKAHSIPQSRRSASLNSALSCKTTFCPDATFCGAVGFVPRGSDGALEARLRGSVLGGPVPPRGPVPGLRPASSVSPPVSCSCASPRSFEVVRQVSSASRRRHQERPHQERHGPGLAAAPAPHPATASSPASSRFMSSAPPQGRRHFQPGPTEVEAEQLAFSTKR